MWLWFAIGGALLMSLSVVFAKCGLKNTDSEIMTFIRTLVVAAVYWGIVYFGGHLEGILSLSLKSVLYLVLTGITIGIAWIFYYKAMKKGDAHKVAAADKLTVIMTAVLSYLIFGETPSSLITVLSFSAILVGVYLIIKRGKLGVWEMIASVIIIVSLLLAYYYFGRSYPLVVKIIYIAIFLAAVICLIIKSIRAGAGSFFVFSMISVFFTALTAILSRMYLAGVGEALAMAIRTLVVLLLLIVVILFSKKWNRLRGVKGDGLLFIILSGLAAGGMWLCISRAGSGAVSEIIGETGLAFTVLLSSAFLKEKLTVRSVLGTLLVTVGCILPLL